MGRLEMHRFESVCGLIRFAVGVLCLLDFVGLVEVLGGKREYVGFLVDFEVPRKLECE